MGRSGRVSNAQDRRLDISTPALTWAASTWSTCAQLRKQGGCIEPGHGGCCSEQGLHETPASPGIYPSGLPRGAPGVTGGTSHQSCRRLRLDRRPRQPQAQQECCRGHRVWPLTCHPRRRSDACSFQAVQFGHLSLGMSCAAGMLAAEAWPRVESWRRQSSSMRPARPVPAHTRAVHDA